MNKTLKVLSLVLAALAGAVLLPSGHYVMHKVDTFGGAAMMALAVLIPVFAGIIAMPRGHEEQGQGVHPDGDTVTNLILDVLREAEINTTTGKIEINAGLEHAVRSAVQSNLKM